VGAREPVDERPLARGALGRERLAERGAPHLGGHALVVLARGGAERLAAALPLGRPDRALAGAARALLLPRLPAAARHLAPPLGVVRARAPRGQLLHHGLVDLRHAHRLREDVGPEIERFLLLALAVEHGNGRHATWPLCLSAAAPWSASRSCAPSRASRYGRERRLARG